jgi:hypothetical protein
MPRRAGRCSRSRGPRSSALAAQHLQVDDRQKWQPGDDLA